MSVPPQVIRVKRKAAEDVPVSYLRVQESKRHRSEVFVYQRQRKDRDATFAQSISAEPQKPVIHTSPPGRQATAFQSAAKQNNHAQSDNGPSKPENTTSTAPPLESTPASEPRKFHMSRRDIMLASHPYARRGVSKKRSAPALFVERKIKRISSRTVEKLRAVSQESGVGHEPTPALAAPAKQTDDSEPRKFKKPGVAKLAPKNSKAHKKPELPKAMTDRWNVDLERLTADMEAYAMEQIGLSIQAAEAGNGQHHLEPRTQKQSGRTTSSNLKFKPKAPSKRYVERNPGEQQNSVDEEMVDADTVADIPTEMETGNSDTDDDYVIETYVRVPASSMGDHVPPQTVGFLVFDEEPDIDFFYGEGDESDDEWAEDEEDENAENYYTADYPDEEVASDDEFGKNPYSFRTHNASDFEEEEYDMVSRERSGSWSSDDGEEDGATSQFRIHIGQNGSRSNHL